METETDLVADLVGGIFSVVESDPGVFTGLTRKLGMRKLEVIELYDIEPWAVDHLNPHGLIFCFYWQKDTHRPADFQDPAAEAVWFANQLSDDACASLALLNIVLNCPDIDIGDQLRMFREDTSKMSPVMKGLAISSSHFIREAHNSMARPADIRGALNAIATTTIDASKPSRGSSKPPAKRRKTNKTRFTENPKPKPKQISTSTDNEAFHFIGYVPAYGKVWELDGFKSGPLEVGELDVSRDPPGSPPKAKHNTWMDVARPALRMKMQKYGASAEGGEIRFSLLAIVDAMYEKASDEWEYWKRERRVLERRLDEIGPEWKAEVNPKSLETSINAFAPPSLLGEDHVASPFADDFSSRRMERDLQILDLPERRLISEWESCVNNAMEAKVALENELSKAAQEHTEHLKRTHDYEPFLAQFVTCLKTEGLLNPLLDLDENGKKIRKPK